MRNKFKNAFRGLRVGFLDSSIQIQLVCMLLAIIACLVIRVGILDFILVCIVCCLVISLAFIDTDAIVTQYYSELYLNEHNEVLESIIATNQYDLILMLSPDVKWVADGKRLNSDRLRRERLHNKLLAMYEEHGFKVEIIEGNYEQRLQKAISLIDEIVSKY